MIQYICTRCRNEWWGGRPDDPDDPEPSYVHGCPECDKPQYMDLIMEDDIIKFHRVPSIHMSKRGCFGLWFGNMEKKKEG